MPVFSQDIRPTPHEHTPHDDNPHDPTSQTAEHEAAEHEAAEHETAEHEAAEHRTAEHEAADHPGAENVSAEDDALDGDAGPDGGHEADDHHRVHEGAAGVVDADSSATPALAVGTAALPPTGMSAPDTGAAPESAQLIGESDVDSFRNRWREVQHRFVDDPAGAADDATTLVEEAVAALTAGVRARQAQLAEAAGASTDTEQLRVRIRTQRDVLNRLLTL
ncbi:MAG TPA: hypothetical protein VFO77_02105 [Actinoplanes sp.]|nr:hypothetical protein [Actinoplanes sp.]